MYMHSPFGVCPVDTVISPALLLVLPLTFDTVDVRSALTHHLVAPSHINNKLFLCIKSFLSINTPQNLFCAVRIKISVKGRQPQQYLAVLDNFSVARTGCLLDILFHLFRIHITISQAKRQLLKTSKTCKWLSSLFSRVARI